MRVSHLKFIVYVTFAFSAYADGDLRDPQSEINHLNFLKKLEVYLEQQAPIPPYCPPGCSSEEKEISQGFYEREMEKHNHFKASMEHLQESYADFCNSLVDVVAFYAEGNWKEVLSDATNREIHDWYSQYLSEKLHLND